MIWRVRQGAIHFEKTVIMGILNLTPDSFSDGGKYVSPQEAAQKAYQMVEAGAQIIDIGAESTRPGAPAISLEEEMVRILPVIELLSGKTSAYLSVDTTKPQVARACLERGAHIINDVSGLHESGLKMAETVFEFGAGLILMHRRGNPGTMQARASYEDLIPEVMTDLKVSIDTALQEGLLVDQIVIDPGIGFSKNTEHSLQVLGQLEKFHALGLPIMVGPSRKSFIGKVTGQEVHRREYGTAAAVTVAVMKGAQIIRVHHVAEMRDVIRMTEAIKGESYVRAF